MVAGRPRQQGEGKSHKKSNAPQEAPVSSAKISIPDDLDEKYHSYFKQIVADMDERSINSMSFIHVVKHLAITLWHIDETLDQMLDGPVTTGAKGSVVANPAFSVFDRLTSKAASLMAILGMTPRDRSSIFPLPNAKKDNPRNKILGGFQLTIDPEITELGEDNE